MGAIKIFFIVGFGGFLGSVGRYYITHISKKLFFENLPIGTPWGTLIVNIIGCFIIGLVYGASEKANILTPEWRLFLATGFCGRFTTFSSFSYDGLNLFSQGESLMAILYITASVLLGLSATYFAITLIR